jgi:hypothetical protein
MIYLIITTSIVNRFTNEPDDHRKNTYLDSIRKTLALLSEDVKPIIVENNGQRTTYLDDIGIPIYYTNNNEISGTHKGVNELEDVKSVIKAFDIQDDDMIIKLTGRYHLLNDSFLKLIACNPDKDAFVSFFNVHRRIYMDYDCVLGMVAIRCKLLKDFSYSIDYKESPETEFARFVKKLPEEKRVSVEKLGLRCCFSGHLLILDV